MPEHVLKMADGTTVALRRSGRARRMILRVGRLDGQAVLTVPPGASLGEAHRFVTAQTAWLARQRAAAPGVQVVAAGAQLPVAGALMTITAQAGLRSARRDGARLLVPADRPAGPVVAAWLRAQAQAALLPGVARHVATLGPPARAFTGISLRDTRSRWGSCSARGRLMFSWRLAMAPPVVLNYVAAHEVAHLRHMDHSPAFWATVAALMPDHDRHRQWLRRHGPGLMAWRFASAAPAP